READRSHGIPINVQHHACGAIEAVVVLGANVPEPAGVLWHRLAGPAPAPQKELEVRSKFPGTQEEFFKRPLAVRQPIAYKDQIAIESRFGGDGVVRLRIEAVVNGITIPGPETNIAFDYRRSPSVREKKVIRWN